MKTLILRLSQLFIFPLVFIVPSAFAQSLSPPDLPGFGTETNGGINGRVIHVTNLKQKGPGSLRDALNQNGKRLIVFEVGGVIDLKTDGLSINNPHVTVAGQTAPGPGITIIRGGIGISTHDVVIRHLRVRPGDGGDIDVGHWQTDAIGTAGGDAHDIVIDHCSLSWATDEVLSASGPRSKGPEATSHRVTFSNNIIAEGLLHATHPKGAHSRGSLIHDFCRNIAVVGNVYAHNNRRNPWFKAHTTGIIVNNLIYNPGDRAIQTRYASSEWSNSSYDPEPSRVSITGNVLQHGPDTKGGLPLVWKGGRAFLHQNVARDRSGESVKIHSDGLSVLEKPPIWPEQYKPLPPAEAVNEVTKYAGATPWNRSPVDQRILKTYRKGNGSIIDSQEEVGGYPRYEPVRRSLNNIPEQNRRRWLRTFEE